MSSTNYPKLLFHASKKKQKEDKSNVREYGFPPFVLILLLCKLSFPCRHYFSLPVRLFSPPEAAREPVVAPRNLLFLVSDPRLTLFATAQARVNEQENAMRFLSNKQQQDKTNELLHATSPKSACVIATLRSTSNRAPATKASAAVGAGAPPAAADAAA